MDLGTFSYSIAVKDLEASRTFYERMGFVVIGGEMDQKWLMMENGTSQIGLFQGMFEENILTWNPKDLAGIKHKLNLQLDEVIHENEKHVMFRDPDGNLILLDKHEANS